MNPLIPVALLGWIALTPLLFALVPHRRAVMVCVIGSALFLPMAQLSATGLPELHKYSTVGWGLGVAIAMFAAVPVFSIRYGVFDLLVAGSFLVPAASILANGLEVTYAISSSLNEFLIYAVPYLAGRVFFRDGAGARELAVGIIIGALIYVPLCWIELRMSPQLHTWVYGFHQHSFLQAYRDGGWRPTVFMAHGLMVAAWMMSAALLSAWLWAGGVQRVWLMPVWGAFGAIAGTLLFLKSLGALLAFGAGLGLLAAVRGLRMPGLVAAIALVPAVYLGARLVLRWDGAEMVQFVDSIKQERAQSLAFRLNSEEILIERALERPLLGWGGYGRNQVLTDEGKPAAITDSFWIAVLGVRGVIGLGCMYGWLTLPAVVTAWRCRGRAMERRDQHVILGLCAVSLLFVIDTMFNAMINQVFFMLCGALVSIGAGLEKLPRTDGRGSRAPVMLGMAGAGMGAGR